MTKIPKNHKSEDKLDLTMVSLIQVSSMQIKYNKTLKNYLYIFMNQQCNQWLYQQLPKGRISSKLFRLSDEWMYKTGLSG